MTLDQNVKCNVRFCRIGTDLICVIIGFIFKATIGIGTIFTAFFMGPIIHWFVEHVAQPILNGKQAVVKDKK